MAITSIPKGVVPQTWVNKFITEYSRGNYFSPFMGKGSTSVIQKIDGLGRGAGDTVNLPLSASRTFGGVEDCATLEGNEKAGFFANQAIRLKLVRDAEVLHKCTTWKTALDLYNAVRDRLKQGFIRKLNFDIAEQLKGIVVPGTGTGLDRASDSVVRYADATAAQRNTHLANNKDRVIFGTTGSTAGTWQAGLDAIAASDRMSAAFVQRAVALAQGTDVYDAAETEGSHLAVTPVMLDENTGEEEYVMFVTPRQFRDAFNDTAIYTANKDAGPRSDKNRIFTGSTLLYFGVVIKRVPGMTGLGANTGGVQVDMAVLAGQQSVVVAWAQAPTPIRNERDYGAQVGVGLEEIRGEAKVAFWGRQKLIQVVTAVAA